MSKYFNYLFNDYFGKAKNVGDLFNWKKHIPNALNAAGEDIKGIASSALGVLDPTGSEAQKNEYDYNLALQEQAQAYNSAEAEKDRRFQEEMSNTSYQRAFKDLEAAGYNPYIALTSGAGASTPGGASASSSAASVSRQNNKSLDTLTKVIEGAMKAGSSSASSLSSIARLIAMVAIAV